MKKNNDIRLQLGLTQEGIAQLLRITRGQWSMYELNRGKLPPHALQILEELVPHVAASDKANQKQSKGERQQAIDRKMAQLQQENAYQLAVTAKKIAQAEKKYATQSRRLQLAQYLESKAIAKSAKAREHMGLLSAKTSKAKEVAALETLIALRVRLKVLELERTVLQEKFKL